jgi:hypothetical protein
MKFKLPSIIQNVLSTSLEREFNLNKNIRTALLAATMIGAPFIATNAEAMKSCGACVYPAPPGHSGGTIPQGVSCFNCHAQPVVTPPVVTPPVVTPPVVTPPVVTPPVVTPPVVTPPVVRPPVVKPPVPKHGSHHQAHQISHRDD